MHFYRASFSQDKIRRIVSDMEHKSWKRKNNTGVPEEVIHHPGAGVEVPLLHFPLLVLCQDLVQVKMRNFSPF